MSKDKNIFKEFISDDLMRQKSFPLDKKIEKAQAVIKEFVDNMGGIDNCRISFSGGKDSTVLIHLVHSVYPDCKSVFFNTGTELPETIQFIKKFENVDWSNPKMQFKDIISKYGFPSISKEQSQYIHDVQVGKSEKQIKYRLGLTSKSYHISNKWLHFLDKAMVNYIICDKCCKILKKDPAKDYAEKNNVKGMFVGTMTDDSILRKNSWLKYGCNLYRQTDVNLSRPLSIWSEDDIWEYIKLYNLEISEAYTKLGCQRTGCYLCPYGSNQEKYPNRFDILYKNKPKMYQYVLHQLGLEQILLDMGTKILSDEEYMKKYEIRQKEIKKWHKEHKENQYQDFKTNILKDKGFDVNE